jgi:hypothetical protein
MTAKSQKDTYTYKTLKKKFWKRGKFGYGYEFGVAQGVPPTLFKGWFVRFYDDKYRTINTHHYRLEERAKEDALSFKLKYGLEGKEL